MADIEEKVTHAQYMQAAGDLGVEAQFSLHLGLSLLAIRMYVADLEQTIQRQSDQLDDAKKVFDNEIAHQVETLKILKTGGPVKACVNAAIQSLEGNGIKLPDEEPADENS